jgi:hypothetical protein
MASMAVPAARAAATPTHTPAERSNFLIAHGLAKYNFRGEDDENDDGYGSKEQFNGRAFNSDVQRAWGPEASRAVGRLRQHLMVYLNDDILAGTLFAPTEGHAYATSATPDGGPGFIVRLRASANEAADAQQDVVFPCTTQQAAALYKLARPAPLGIEGQGDVVDLAKRKARELPASDLELPPFLRGANLPAAFPHVVESIHKRLAATMDGILFEEYKLNVGSS